jgi:hypothetical protein
MSPEFLKALELINPPADPQIPEYRLYYDDEGMITGFSERDHAEGNYILLDNPDVFFKNNTFLLRVIDKKLVVLSNSPPPRPQLQRSTTGQPTVKGHAALALTSSNEYKDIEYYDRKTNN